MFTNVQCYHPGKQNNQMGWSFHVILSANKIRRKNTQFIYFGGLPMKVNVGFLNSNKWIFIWTMKTRFITDKIFPEYFLKYLLSNLFAGYNSDST